MQGVCILEVKLPARSNQYLPWGLEFKLHLLFSLLEPLNYKILCGKKDLIFKKISIVLESLENRIYSGNDAILLSTRNGRWPARAG